MARETALIRSLRDKLRADCEVGLITNTHSTFGNLLTCVLAGFKIESTASNKAKRYQAFVDFITLTNELS
ncbi:hypothetical protein [Methyloprofundus sp.]|uniref:hypothetical protein n=1 Tax=Methyloprofundus sp. TaxID=2020875 RepID=UPI0026280F58|nr:hypothetical protein [Methyloprofundus sp.]